jgi:hypothetical protein
VDLIGGGSDRRVLVLAGTNSLTVLVLGNAVALCAEYFRGRYAHRIGHGLRVRMVRGLLARRYEYFTGVSTSTLLKIIADDAGLLGGQLISPALESCVSRRRFPQNRGALIGNDRVAPPFGCRFDHFLEHAILQINMPECVSTIVGASWSIGACAMRGKRYAFKMLPEFAFS